MRPAALQMTAVTIRKGEVKPDGRGFELLAASVAMNAYWYMSVKFG
ncbi:hypothetical protein [Silicimonas sp. MF1-12-2]